MAAVLRFAVGAALLVAGVAILSPAAALIVAGAIVMAVGLDLSL